MSVSEITFKMTNAELQQAINDTAKTLQYFRDDTELYYKLDRHLNELLLIQRKRAGMAIAAGMVTE